ncbi:hypothetical protein CC86DRAFT_400186 [Ophiobolus disseminans]|uniref:Uncharacterized protein n=1 Tax=Ophiobolus disseminans TaxID=1469910 RepID=A0A6A7AKQ1_9PLEO|nr:hypothetical protein CC86DRAFT_400186 [Ophiobolus disseminans]
MVYEHLVHASGAVDLLDHCDKSPFFAINPTYVPKDMARKVLELYYARTDFSWSIDNGDIDAALIRDVFDLGVSPCNYITDLCLITEFDGPKGYSEKQRMYEAYAQKYVELAGLVTAVLELVKRKDRLTIRTALRTRPPEAYAFEDEKLIVMIIELMRQPVYDLATTCRRRCITHCNIGGYEQEDLGSRDICDWFRLNKKVWEKERATQLDDFEGSKYYVPNIVFDYTSTSRSKFRRALMARWGVEQALSGFEYALRGHDSGPEIDDREYDEILLEHESDRHALNRYVGEMENRGERGGRGAKRARTSRRKLL